MIAISVILSAFINRQLAVAEAPTDNDLYIGWFQAKDDTIFQAIAVCESGNNPNAKNKYSSASGRFQFINSTWEWTAKSMWGDNWQEKDKFDFQDNSELAWYLYDYGRGVNHWECYTKNML